MRRANGEIAVGSRAISSLLREKVAKYVASQLDGRPIKSARQLVGADVIHENRITDVVVRFALPQEGSEPAESHVFVRVNSFDPILSWESAERRTTFRWII